MAVPVEPVTVEGAVTVDNGVDSSNTVAEVPVLSSLRGESQSAVELSEARQSASRENFEGAGDLGAGALSLNPSEGSSSSHEIQDFVSNDHTVGATLEDAATGEAKVSGHRRKILIIGGLSILMNYIDHFQRTPKN
ncbi:hypothetical protein V6N12_056953 [Hibiscus sabdariffa]|uniref:Uncharacterized protein n=1 Tax=Hibiscus sabdariffa TaxID=183260 RepID=A0ABR2DCK5_9ROSI